MPREALFERATLLEGQHGNHYLTAFRLIHDGILSTGSTRGQREYYLEANTHGIVFFEAPGEINGTVPDYATNGGGHPRSVLMVEKSASCDLTWVV